MVLSTVDSGDVMKLSDEDGRIVDLLLDKQITIPANNDTFVQSADVQPQRMQTIQQILTLLKQLPAEEPSPDLGSRTVRKVDAAIAAINATPPGANAQALGRSDARPPA